MTAWECRKARTIMLIKDLSGTQGSGLTLATDLVCDIKKTILFPYSLLLYLSKTLLSLNSFSTGAGVNYKLLGIISVPSCHVI